MLDVWVVSSFLLVLLRASGAVPCQRTIEVAENALELTSDNFPLDYEDYTMCRYLITAPDNQHIKLNFTAFDLESSPQCINDYVKIFDLAKPGIAEILSQLPPCRPMWHPILGIYSLKPLAGPFCGSSMPNGFISRGNQVVLEFCSDYALVGKGFRIVIMREPAPAKPVPKPCTETLELSDASSRVRIRTPNFPSNYDAGRPCSWTVKTKKSHAVRVDIREFYVGDGGAWGDCGDILSIADVSNDVFYQYCGETPAPSTLILRPTEEILVDFIPDEWDSYKGVDIEISYEVCGKGTYACDDYDGCVNATNYCDGVAHCKDKSDEKKEYCAPDCGVPHFPVHTGGDKIVGGSSAVQHSLPWQVAMLENGFQFCGGALISDRWIVTAAHCFTAGNKPSYKARIGGHQLDFSTEKDRALEIPFEKVICHPLYQKAKAFDFDLCLIKMNETVKFRKNIVPVCLPRHGDDPAPGTQCLISGWGNTPQVGRSTDGESRQTRSTTELRQVYVPVVDRQRCNDTDVYNGQITDSMICAGLWEGGRDSCQGDSGGPFVCQDSRKKWMLNGVVSWADGCAKPGKPGLNGRVGSAVEWMIQTMVTN